MILYFLVFILAVVIGIILTFVAAKDLERTLEEMNHGNDSRPR